MAGSQMEIGVSFAKKYYHDMSQSPSSLASMYSAQSEMVSENGETVIGVDAIKEILNNKGLHERKFRLTGVVGYPSQNESVVVLVRGTVLTRKSSSNFAQTFVLAKRQEGCYFIYNDILEFLGEEEAPVAAPVAVSAPVVVEPVPEPEPEPVYEPVVEEPVVEEPVPEPEAEPVKEVEEEVVEEKAPTPVPTPPTKPVEAPKPTTPKPETFGWANIVAKGAAAPVSTKQVVCGGQAPGLHGAMSRAEREEKKDKKRGVSPSKGGSRQRGSSPQRFTKSYSIFVSNVGKDTTKTDIEKLFGKFGKTTGAPTVNTERAFAFVDFAEKKSMEDAIAASNSQSIVLDGQTLKCSERTSPEKRAAQSKSDAAKRTGDKPRGINGAAPAARRK